MDAADVKAWLSEIGRSRKWLADELGITYGTLTNQLYTNRLSKYVKAKLEEMMRQPVPEVLMTADDWAKVAQAMRHAGYDSRDEFYRDAIRRYAEKIIAERDGPSAS